MTYIIIYIYTVYVFIYVCVSGVQKLKWMSFPFDLAGQERTKAQRRAGGRM